MSATILVVDDHADNRALARETLEDEGYTVLLANNGEDAIAVFEREQPECILLDVRMPGIDGPTTCARIRALPRGALVSIVFVTAQHDLETFDRALAAGGDDFLTKPFRPRELVGRVETALKLRALASERNELYSEIKHQRDQLQRIQLQKEQLIAFLVHDLKGPVHAIELHAQLALRDPDASARTRRSIAKIRDEGQSQLRMITTLLDIAKADEAALAPLRERIELEKLVAQVIDTMNVHAVASGVALVGEAVSTTVNGDPNLLRRVLENLTENAIRHSPEGATVHVTATATDGAVAIRVLDEGPACRQSNVRGCSSGFRRARRHARTAVLDSRSASSR